MTHVTRFVVVAVLVVLAVDVPVQAQTPEIDALRVRAEQAMLWRSSISGSCTKTVKASRRTLARRRGGAGCRPQEVPVSFETVHLLGR